MDPISSRRPERQASAPTSVYRPQDSRDYYRGRGRRGGDIDNVRRLNRPLTEAERLRHDVSPFNWWRAFLSGALGATLMMLFMDIFSVLGATPFTFEMYVGSLLVGTQFRDHIWMVGLLANWVLGGLFGFLYAYFFEYVFVRATARIGIVIGVLHAVVAALLLFPFFEAVAEHGRIEVFQDFGFFGAGYNAATPILLLIGHMLFGSFIGTFYGPVGLERVHSRAFEEGESARPGENGVISEDEDSEMRAV